MSVLLDSLAAGQSGIICGYLEESQEILRLMQMGLVEGSAVKVIRKAPTGDPIEIEVLGYALSLRRSQASQVLLTAVD